MTYPELDLKEFDNLMYIINEAINDPAYLDPAKCPYDAPVRDRIAKVIFVGTTTQAVAEKNPVGRPSKKTVLPIDEVEKEVNEIRKEISQLKVDAKGLETADRIQIIKTRAALVEKIIAMKERITNIKQQQQFIANVMGIMEDVLEQSQREEVIAKLEPFVNE